MSHSQLQSKNGGTCTEWFPSNLLGETSLEALRFPSCGGGIETDLFHAGDGPKPEFLGSLPDRVPAKTTKTGGINDIGPGDPGARPPARGYTARRGGRCCWLSAPPP